MTLGEGEMKSFYMAIMHVIWFWVVTSFILYIFVCINSILFNEETITLIDILLGWLKILYRIATNLW